MIKPIDLQTLFVKMNDVGKEQVQQKELGNLQQSQEASKLVQRELARDHSVNETAEEKETDAVRDKQEQDERRKEKRRDNQGSSEDGSEEDKPEKAQDPEVGRHIDITG